MRTLLWLALLGGVAGMELTLSPAAGSSGAEIPLNELSVTLDSPLDPLGNSSCAISVLRWSQDPAAGDSAAASAWETVYVNQSATATAGGVVTLSLAREVDSFSTWLSVQVPPGCFSPDFPGLQELDWAFSTTAAPTIDTGNTTTTPRRIQVMGVGVFILDVAAIDSSAGTFYADTQLFLLEHYRDFDDEEEALRDATEESVTGSRICKARGADAAQWVFLSNATVAETIDRLVFVNIGKLPKVTVSLKHDETTVDHVRVQSEFYFQPTLAKYPFNSQSLPITMELAADSVQSHPSVLLCGLEKFSGFPRSLSSFAALTEADPLTADFDVAERVNWPPFESGSHRLPLLYPSVAGDAPSRYSSRLAFTMNWTRGTLFGLLELAPAGFIGLSALISYSLPHTEYRAAMTTATTALLSAIVQHTSIRARVPQQSRLTWADLVMVIVYVIVMCAFVGAVAVAVLQRDPEYHLYSAEVHDIARLLGPATVCLFVVFAFEDPASATAWTFASLLAASVFAALVMARRVRHRQQAAAGRALWRHRPQVRQWSVADVAHWLSLSAELRHVGIPSVALRFYSSRFAFERIDGVALAALNEARIAAMGVPLGDAAKLYQEVEALLELAAAAEEDSPSSSASSASDPDPDPEAEITVSEAAHAGTPRVGQDLEMVPLL